MAKVSLQVLLLFLFLQSQLTAADFTVEEPKLPYDLNIVFYDRIETGHLTLSNRQLIDRDWELDDFIQFDRAKSADIDVSLNLDNDNFSKKGTTPENSLTLKTTGGHSVVIIIDRNLFTLENETRFAYVAHADSKTPLAELYELLLRTFAKETHFSYFRTNSLDTFSTSNAMLEAVISTGKQIQYCHIRYGAQAPSLDLVTRFVNTVKPSMFRLGIGEGIKDYQAIEPGLQLPDSFFQSHVVRNLSRLQLEWIDTKLSDESLNHLNAVVLRMRAAPNVTGKGLLQWLKQVMDGDVREKAFVASSRSAQSLLDGLAPLVDYTVEKEDESWTITGIKNGTRIRPTNLKITHFTDKEVALMQLAAERDYSKKYDNGTPTSRNNFAVVAVLFSCAVLFSSNL